MIELKYPKTKTNCAICKKDSIARSAMLFDRTKTAGNRFVHVDCWEQLRISRGEEPTPVPPF